MIRLPLLVLIVAALAVATPFTTAISPRPVAVRAAWQNNFADLQARDMHAAVKSPVPLRLDPVLPPSDGAAGPMTYNISTGMHSGNLHLRDQIGKRLDQDRPAIDALLRTHHVPQALN